MVKQSQMSGQNIERYMTAKQTLDFYKGDQDGNAHSNTHCTYLCASQPPKELGGQQAPVAKGSQGRIRYLCSARCTSDQIVEREVTLEIASGSVELLNNFEKVFLSASAVLQTLQEKLV